MDEKKLQKEIETNVWKYCPYRFDDPETKIKDSCGLHDCHCIAIDSLYSHINSKKSICKIYNELVPRRKRTAAKIVKKSKKKRCSACNKLYVPTGNRQKFCSSCSEDMKKKAAISRKKYERKTKTDEYRKIMLDVTL